MPVRVVWEGSRPPTAAERRAICRGVRSGSIVDGSRVRPMPRKNPARAADAYEAFHWGEPARTRRRVRVPNVGVVYELGKLRRVDYETKKDGERAIWFHDFERPYPTLTATASGRLGPIVGGGARVKPEGITG